MPATLQLTHIALRVTDLTRSEAFYVGRLGFIVSQRRSDRLALATSTDSSPILTLESTPDRSPPLSPTAGLFHAALLFPHRVGLASCLASAAAHQVEFSGFSDHAVSEALYLSDPDGNGWEFYCDRPREVWPFAGREVAMTTRVLDVRALLADAEPTATPLSGASWGHLHLRVTDLARSETFYRSTLGVVTTQSTYPGARFMAADGYHHHLGLNTWGHPRGPQPPIGPGLASATFAIAGLAAPRTVSDPDGITVRLEPLP